MPLPLVAYAGYAAVGALAAAGYLAMPSIGNPRKTNAQVMGEGLAQGAEALSDGVSGVFSSSAENADDAASNTLSETGTAVDACSNCQPPQCPDIVDRMQHKNRELKRELRKYDPVEDARGGHQYFRPNGQPATTVPGGHYTEIRQLQRGINNDLEAYNRNQCYSNAPRSDRRTLRAAQQSVNQQIEVPPGISFMPL